LGGSPRRLFFCKRTQRPGRRKSGSVLGWTATGHRLTAVGLGPTDRSPFEGLRSSTTAVQPRFGSVAPTLEGVDPTSRRLVGRGSQAFDGRGPGAVGARPISSPRFGASDAAAGSIPRFACPMSTIGSYLPAGISRQVVGRLIPVGFAVAITTRTPFARIFADVIGEPWVLLTCAPLSAGLSSPGPKKRVERGGGAFKGDFGRANGSRRLRRFLSAPLNQFGQTAR
jgi:hypothetical protein